MSLGFGNFLKEQWTKIPYPEGPLDGKVVIVTGSNTGLGKEAARHAVRLNADTVILAVRNVEKGEEAKKDILASQPKSKSKVHVWKLDLGTFAGTRKFADKVNRELPRLDSAILNAGIATRQWSMSPDGWESTIQTNDLSTAYLALLLYPKLVESASTATSTPHLSIVSSEVHYWSPFKEREAENILLRLNDEKHFNPPDRYQVSKLLNVYFTRSIAEYASKHDGGKVIVNTVNPGLCKSELSREAKGIERVLFWLFKALLARTTEVGSRTLMHAGTQCGTETHGEFLSACRNKTAAKLVSGPEGPELQKRVWKEFGEILTKQEPSLSKYFAD